MNFRDKTIPTSKLRGFDFFIKSCENNIDNKWPFRKKVLEAICTTIKSNTFEHDLVFGFIRCMKHKHMISVRSKELANMALLIPKSDYELYEGLAESLRQCSAKARAMVRFR